VNQEQAIVDCQRQDVLGSLDFRAGDILAFYGSPRLPKRVRHLVPWWISLRTSSLRGCPKWSPSHVGILVRLPGVSEVGPLLVESTTLSRLPCLIRGEPVSGVQVHHPWDRIEEYTAGGGWVDVYRPHGWWALSDVEERLLTDLVEKRLLALSIDYDMGGAIWSGPNWVEWLGLTLPEDLSRLFCSETIAAIEMSLNRMNHKPAGRFNPGRLIRRLTFTGKVQRVARFV